MDGFDEGLIVPNLGAFNGSFDCTKWMGLMKV
jgi:hypothetical protein